MQIKMDPSVSSQPQGQKEVSLKQGDLFSATVKSKHGNETILLVRGQEVKVKTDGKLPDSGRVQLEVTGTKEGLPMVRQSQQQTSAQAHDFVKMNDGKPLSPELKNALQHLSAKGVKVDPALVKELNQFLSKTDATPQQKLETIQAAVSKNLDLTANKLSAIHSALHGPPISKAVSELLSSARVDVSSGQRHSASQIQQAARQQLIQALNLLAKGAPAEVKEMIRQLEATGDVKAIASETQKVLSSLLKENPEAAKLLQNALKLDSLIQPVVQPQTIDQSKALLVQDAKTAIQKMPDISKVTEQFKVLANNPEMNGDVRQALQQAAAKAEQFVQNGQELQARQVMMQGIEQAAAAYPLKAASEQYMLSDELTSQIPMHSRDVIVMRVSEKMSQAAIDFKNIQKDMTRNLSQIEFAANRQQALQQSKPLLEATIRMLDKAILKGDFMLYTNMETEKDLLKASGQLAEASKLLAKGEVAQAARITSEVKAMMEKIEFKPSDVKVQHFVSKEIMQLEQPSLQKLTAQNLQQSMQNLRNEPSARHAFEHVRAMGMTFENEQAHSLLNKSQDQAASLKGMLMKMAGEGKADQTLTQLTGQQLLSKTDASGLQSMVMTLPFILQEKVESFKVYMQSKNGSQKVDWENCNLYFLFDTKKLGEIGVSLNVSERNLSIKMKNDQPDFEKKMEPITSLAKDRLEKIGYSVQQLQFDRLTAEEINEVSAEPAQAVPVMTEKGYDFSI
ncbi:hypothetical protein [Jeotgalibacillus haloalkalitolerans]|uniref:Flagellar hook-length control protein-like C-terminal domain-containing protein n=1 Tax=Jeotgalibacillus haloalkalitolerans TaxID=3104292 RepID=A0ABU5KJN0_9BACL|nr:hypothetical protein [Jeotgalibacillus sp. HH7-29]MDZ5711470.1 hypothetical protein [Jeotgalibacillus sp. HH7-29]